MGRAYEVRKASIQKTGAAKAKVYTMYAKEIYSIAKKNPDPDTNPNLKRLIEKAKKDQVPSEIIKRAIDKVSSGIDESYEKLRYEGFGPGESTLIIDCLTDNVNRTISLLRTVFSKTHCKLGSSGAVSYMYDDLCVLSIKELKEEEILEILINKEINADVEQNNNIVTVYGNPQDLFKIKNAILEYNQNIDFITDEITTLPKETINLEKEEQELFEKLLNLIEEIEDVQEVYHNVNLQ